MGKFLEVLYKLVQSGAIKKIDQALKFAKNEFGEVTPLFKKQIENVFSKVKKPKVGKEVKKEGDILPFKPKEGIKTLEKEVSPLMKKLEKSTKDPKVKDFMKGMEEGMEVASKAKYLTSRGREADVRTAVRQFLKTEVESGRLNIPDAADFDAITGEYRSGVDPIEIFEKAYGNDALAALDDVMDQFPDSLRGDSYADIEKNFRKLFRRNRGFYEEADLPIPKKEYGFETNRVTDPLEEEKLRQINDFEKYDPKDFDPDRNLNAYGGIQRTEFSIGGKGIKALAKLLGKKKTDEGRRDFMKTAGMGAAGIAALKTGLIGLGEKIIPAAQEVASGLQGVPPYFIKLVAKIKSLGDDVTQTQSLADRQTVTKYKDFELTEDLATGRQEITRYKVDGSTNDKFEYDASEYYGKPLTEETYMSYTPGKEVFQETAKGKTKIIKTQPDYEEFRSLVRNDGRNSGEIIEEISGVSDDIFEEVGEEVPEAIRKGKADGGRIGFSKGKLAKKVIELFKGLKKSKKLNDDEYQDFVDEVGPDQLEAYDFDGTVGDAQRIIKEQKQYLENMYSQYKMGKLDPEAGDTSQARKRFLQQKLDEMEMSGDSKLMSQDEIEELSTFDLGTDIDNAKLSVNDEIRQGVDEIMSDTSPAALEKSIEVDNLMLEYPGMGRELAKQIASDPNPDRKAQVIAMVEQTFELDKQGKTGEEIIDIFKQGTDRTKQANGGFNTITLDKNFTKIFEDASSKKLAARGEKQATREKRYRDLIASNKFPELNDFFKEKISTRVQANIGGSFTTGEQQKRANTSYQDYLARMKTAGTNFTPGGINNPKVNFPDFNSPTPPTTSPTPPTTSPTPPGGGGGTGGGSVYPGITPPNYIPPGGGGSSGGGGGSSGGGGSTKPFDPGMPMGSASGAEAIAAYKNYLAGVDRSTTPFQMFDQWRKGTNKYATDQLLYDLTDEEGQNQYQSDRSYLNSLKGWEDPRGGTGKEAIAEYEKYLAGLTSGSPLGFDSWRSGTKYNDSMSFLDDDYKKLLGIKDLVSKGQDSGTFKYNLDGYIGKDPRGPGGGYTGDGLDEGSETAPPGYEGDDSETFLEKQKREAEEAAAKKEQEEGGAQDEGFDIENWKPAPVVEQISNEIESVAPEKQQQYIQANSDKPIGQDSKGKWFTLGNLIKAGLFYASGGLSGGIEQAITTAAKQYAKKKAIDYAKEKIGIGSSQAELPETALSNNLIGSNNNMNLKKGGRVKLFDGGIPGFTEAEIAQRRQQQQQDAAARNQTFASPRPYPNRPSAPEQFNRPMIPEQTTTRPIDSPSPGTGAPYKAIMGEQGALPGFGTENPGGEEYISPQPYMPSMPMPNQPMDEMPPGIMGAGPGQGGDPMLAKYGISGDVYANMTSDQQDDFFAAVDYTEQYGREPNTQMMILKERGIDPSQFQRQDGSIDRLGLNQEYVKSGITDLFTKSKDPARSSPEMQEYFQLEDAKKDLVPADLKQQFMPTGNESFQELVELEKKAYAAFNQWENSMRQQYGNTPGHPFFQQTSSSSGGGNSGGAPVYTPGEQIKKIIGYQPSDRSPGNSIAMASGGRAGLKFGSMLKTKNPNFGKVKKSKSHEYLLQLLKSKQNKQLTNSLKKMVSKNKKITDKSPEEIAKAMKKLQQLRSAYGKA